MEKQLTADDARQSLTSHVAAKGAEINELYGPTIGWNELERILQDRTCVRYPCEIKFGSQPLMEGELAHPEPKGDQPDAGFDMVVHPVYAGDPNAVVYLVLYQLVIVNYGEFASAEDAETFGAHVLGISKEDYYQSLCALADKLPVAA